MATFLTAFENHKLSSVSLQFFTNIIIISWSSLASKRKIKILLMQTKGFSNRKGYVSHKLLYRYSQLSFGVGDNWLGMHTANHVIWNSQNNMSFVARFHWSVWCEQIYVYGIFSHQLLISVHFSICVFMFHSLLSCQIWKKLVRFA